MERKLSAILAADVVGYSRMIRADEEGTLLALRAIRTELIDPRIIEHSGRVVKLMGDGALLEFGSVVDAVACSVAIQQCITLRNEGVPSDKQIEFRLGINLGDVVVDGQDIQGDGVNIAARLETLAQPGGICISGAVHDQIRDRLDVKFEYLGDQELKNIDRPIPVWHWVLPGTSHSFHSLVSQSSPSYLGRLSVAVLPFENMSGDPQQDFLAEGIVDDVISQLSRFHSLSVIARSSTFAFKDLDRDLDKIAMGLGCRYLVEGSVRRSGQRIRVTARLVEASTHTQIWSRRFDEEMDDFFGLQDEISIAIANGIEPELEAHERNLAKRKSPKNMDAWELYQRGISELVKYKEQGALDRGIHFMKAAIDAEPEFATPHTGLAWCLWAKVATRHPKNREAIIEESLKLARRGVYLDDRSEFAQSVLAQVLSMAGFSRESREASKLALSLNSNSARVLYSCAQAEIFQPEPDLDSMEENAKAAMKLDPNSPLSWAYFLLIGHARLWRSFNWEDLSVLEAYEASAAAPNSDFTPYFYAAIASASVGRLEMAQRHLEQAMSLRPELNANSWRRIQKSPIFQRMVDAAEPALEKLIEVGLPAK